MSLNAFNNLEASKPYSPADFGHKDLAELDSLPKGHLQREAYELAKLIASFTPDPELNLYTPRPLMVGSFVLTPQTATDLDIEVFGVSWDHLQTEFKKHESLFEKVFYTKGFEDGRIPQDKDSKEKGFGGNAFVCVWLTLKSGIKANITIPIEVSEKSHRYNMHSVNYKPELSINDSLTRRIFLGLGKSSAFDPLARELVDPLNDISLTKQKKLELTRPELYQSDPLNIFITIKTFLDKEYTLTKSLAAEFNKLCKNATKNIDNPTYLNTTRMHNEIKKLSTSGLSETIQIAEVIQNIIQGHPDNSNLEFLLTLVTFKKFIAKLEERK